MDQQLLFITKATDTLKSIEINGNSYGVGFSDKILEVDNLLPQTAKNTIYLIDVHYSYENQKLQEQPGVDFYRRLLKKYETVSEGLDNLKVVFYSPLPQDYLVDKKPENYILSVLPFIQFTADGTFKERLEKLVIKHTQNNSWPVFNVASENLLSGWSLVEQKKISVQAEEKPRISIVDDEMSQWKNTFKLIFDNSMKLHLHNYKRNEGQYSFNNIEGNKQFLKRADLVISDFYLEENHEPSDWLNQDELSSKSGFKFYKDVVIGDGSKSGVNAGVPFIVHSSSNKVPYFKFLQAHGIDDWCVKDVNYKTTKNNKVNYFTLFKSQVEHYVSKENFKRYNYFKQIWNDIIKLENPKRVENLWWKDDGDLVIREFKNACYDIKRFLSQKRYYVQEMRVDNESYVSSSIISNLNKLIEFWEKSISEKKKDTPEKKIKKNFLYSSLKHIRNNAAHFRGEKLSIDDAILYLKVLVCVFETKIVSSDYLFKPRIGDNTYPEYFISIKGETKDKKMPIKFKSALLIFYCQMYNAKFISSYLIDENDKKIIYKILESLIFKKVDDVNSQNRENELINEIDKHQIPKKITNKDFRNRLKLVKLISGSLRKNKPIGVKFINDKILLESNA